MARVHRVNVSNHIGTRLGAIVQAGEKVLHLRHGRFPIVQLEERRIKLGSRRVVQITNRFSIVIAFLVLLLQVSPEQLLNDLALQLSTIDENASLVTFEQDAVAKTGCITIEFIVNADYVTLGKL